MREENEFAVAKMQPQQYCLKWKYHSANIQATFAMLRDKACYCDVTLWCGGAAMRAHRAVLAACSGLFGELLANHDPSLGEPALILTDSVHAYHLRHLLSFMYSGEVNVHHSELESLLKTAEELQIKGLADVSWKDSSDPTAEKSTAAGTEISVAPTASSDAKKDDNHAGSRVTIKKGSISLVPKAVNGRSSSLTIPVVSGERPRKRRGRPPLEPKSITTENEVSVPEGPKRPNILRKSKPVEQKSGVVLTESSTNWSSGNQENESQDLLSEYSEASLDGQDISHFLDTTMEVSSDIISSNLSADRAMTIIPSSLPSEESSGTVANDTTHPLFTDVVKLSDYLLSGRRTQFWNEDYVRRVMEAVFCKELEMKQAAEILGVSYGTLYGRYRDTFGCINRPNRSREFWAENSEIIGKLQRQEVTFLKAAELLNVTPHMLFTYVNTIAEPSSNILDSFAEVLMRAQSDSKSNSSDNDVGGASDDVMSTSEAGNYNRLSDMLRRKHEQQESSVMETEPAIKIEDSPADSDDSSEIPSPSPELIVKRAKIDANSPGDKIGKVEASSSAVSLDSGKSEPSSSSTLSVSPPSNDSAKKLPTIRVANLKYLKGDGNVVEMGGDNPKVFKTMSSLIRSDIKMMSSKRKVSFEEIEHSLKNSKKATAAANSVIVNKSPASIT